MKETVSRIGERKVEGGWVGAEPDFPEGRAMADSKECVWKGKGEVMC